MKEVKKRRKQKQYKRHPLYGRWREMRARCFNPNNKSYKNYGARGITVCDEWNTSFKAFVESMGLPPTPKHMIDRIDNNKGYSPENCRWATNSEQQLNKRKLRKTKFKYKGLYQIKNSNKIGAYIKYGDKRIGLGTFNSDIEAAQAYDKKYFELHGHRKGCNFRSEYSAGNESSKGDGNA